MLRFSGLQNNLIAIKREERERDIYSGKLKRKTQARHNYEEITTWNSQYNDYVTGGLERERIKGKEEEQGVKLESM